MLTMLDRRKSTATVLFACVCGFLLQASAKAQFVGTNVTGFMDISSQGINYFSPLLHHVPNGDLNFTQGTTVTVSATAEEFGYIDNDINNQSHNLDTVDLTATTITLTNLSDGTGSPDVFYSLTDGVFSEAGSHFTLTANTFGTNLLNWVLAGSTIDIHIAAFNKNTPQSLTLTFTPPPPPSPAPEPGSFAFMLSAGMSAGAALRRRASAKRAA